MPEAHEIERKFLVLNYQPKRMPPEAVTVLITQDYLTSAPAVGRRVRKRALNGTSTYFYTEKRETGTPGDRMEKEDQISKEAYELLLRERQEDIETIIKERITYAYDSHFLEFDNYIVPGNLWWLHVLEVEVPDIATPITLPPELEVREVTHLPIFSNYEIAKGSLQGKGLTDVLAML